MIYDPHLSELSPAFSQLPERNGWPRARPKNWRVVAALSEQGGLRVIFRLLNQESGSNGICAPSSQPLISKHSTQSSGLTGRTALLNQNDSRASILSGVVRQRGRRVWNFCRPQLFLFRPHFSWPPEPKRNGCLTRTPAPHRSAWYP